MCACLPTVLSERLKHLEHHGLLRREFYSEHPPRAHYVLTDKGIDLGSIVGTMTTWGSRHVLPDRPLTHTECGGPLEAGFFCPACGKRASEGTVKMPEPAHQAG